jgi:hypothetical protein
MNRVVKTVKTYDYGNGVFVDKEDGKIIKIWIDEWPDYVAFNSDGVHKNRDFLRVGVECGRDAVGKYCYFVNKINHTTIVVWETRAQLLKGIPKVISQNRASLLAIPGKEKGTAYKSVDGRSVSHEMAQREEELQEFLKKPTGEVIGRFKQPTIKHFSEGDNARVQSLANILGVNIDDVISGIDDVSITVDWLVNKIKIISNERAKSKYDTVSLKSDKVLLVNELDDGDKPLSASDINKIIDLKVSKEINQENDRLRLLDITTAAQDKYGTLFNCLRIFGAHDDEKILARHVDYLDLHEPITNGFDVAIAIRQTHDCAQEELNTVKNLLTHDEVLHLVGVLENVF